MVSGIHALEELRLSLARCAGMLAEHRADLIEALGDHLCGSGGGPSSEAVERLRALERLHETLRSSYEKELAQQLP